MQTQFRRAYEKRVYMSTFANRRARRNAARLVAIATSHGHSEVTTESGTVKLYARPYVVDGAAIRTVAPSAGAVGPFKTMRAAEYYTAHPGITKAEAERLSKLA